MPPSRYLGLPLVEWGETDFLLTQAYDRLDLLRCSCGCGQWADLAHDPDTEDRWQVDDDTTCYAKAAVAAHHEAHPKPAPGAVPMIRLLPPGASSGFDPERAALEVAERDARLQALQQH